MADISKITLPSGTTYDIKDVTARNLAAGGIQLRGATTTALTDEATTNPITINGESYTAKNQDAVFYNKKEFVFDGTKWHEFGDMSGLGSLAYKNSATGSGTVAVPKTYTTTVTPAAKDVSVTGTTTGTVNVTKGKVAVSKAASGEATYTPQGSVSAPTITVTPAKSSVTGIDSVGTLPSLSATVADETLTLGFSQGSLPTKATAVDVVTGISSATASQPTFTGTGARLVTDSDVATDASFTGASMTSTGSYTPAAPTASTATATTENKSVSITVS